MEVMKDNFHNFFKINSASIHKDKYFEYKQYHTSADNLDF